MQHSAHNIQTRTDDGVDAWANSIARIGLLQSLVVCSAPGERYAVLTSGRRLAALQDLIAAKRLPSTYPVPVPAFAGNARHKRKSRGKHRRHAMHPPDQFVAFKRLADEGRPIEDITSGFGVNTAGGGSATQARGAVPEIA